MNLRAAKAGCTISAPDLVSQYSSMEQEAFHESLSLTDEL